MSNPSNSVEFQIEEFFTRWPFSSLQQLRCLSLVYLGEMACDCSTLLLEQLAQLPYVERLHIRVGRIAHYDRCLKRLFQLIFTEHDAFRSLKQLIFQQCDRTNQLLSMPTPVKHMQTESITLHSLNITAFLSVLPRAPRLKSIKVNSLCSDSDETMSMDPSSSKVVLRDCAYLNLHLAYHLQFDGIKLVLEKVPNLTRLKIACDFVLANGDRWETLLTEHCPRLRKLEIRFSLHHHFFDRAPLSELQQSFSTTFWLERNVHIEQDNEFYRLNIRFRIEA